MQVALLHPTGNKNVRAILAALLKANMLAEFDTTIGITAEANWPTLLPASVRQELSRRTYSLPSQKLAAHPYLEIARMLLPKVGLNGWTKHESGFASIDAVYHNLDSIVANRLPGLVRTHQINAVYAYEDGALATFSQAKKFGIKCIYDLPIAYWETGRKLLTEEAERLPKWAVTLGGGIKDSQEKLDRKTRELELADVVTGPGQFVMDSLPTWAGNKKVIMSAFGSPEIQPGSNKESNQKVKSERPLRVLFVGSMGQRKGLGDLFAAVRLLKNPEIELIVMGTPLAPMEFYRNELTNFTYEHGRSHQEVLALMRSCDVFCLPSIVEGRALVMQEAMSQGLPLIITANTGGADLIIEGVTGFLVPIRSPEAIAQKLSWFLENSDRIPWMGEMAQKHAADYTWENYGDKIVNSLKESLD